MALPFLGLWLRDLRFSLGRLSTLEFGPQWLKGVLSEASPLEYEFCANTNESYVGSMDSPICARETPPGSACF